MQRETITKIRVTAPDQSNSTSLPSTGFCRLWQIVGDKKRNIPAVLPISRSTFLSRVKDGTYPQPIKLGERSVAWRVEDIRDLINSLGGAA